MHFNFTFAQMFYSALSKIEKRTNWETSNDECEIKCIWAQFRFECRASHFINFFANWIVANSLLFNFTKYSKLKLVLFALPSRRHSPHKSRIWANSTCSRCFSRRVEKEINKSWILFFVENENVIILFEGI